jgi:hypothetical protein
MNELMINIAYNAYFFPSLEMSDDHKKTNIKNLLLLLLFATQQNKDISFFGFIYMLLLLFPPAA